MKKISKKSIIFLAVLILVMLISFHIYRVEKIWIQCKHDGMVLYNEDLKTKNFTYKEFGHNESYGCIYLGTYEDPEGSSGRDGKKQSSFVKNVSTGKVIIKSSDPGWESFIIDNFLD